MCEFPAHNKIISLELHVREVGKDGVPPLQDPGPQFTSICGERTTSGHLPPRSILMRSLTALELENAQHAPQYCNIANYVGCVSHRSYLWNVLVAWWCREVDLPLLTRPSPVPTLRHLRFLNGARSMN